MNREFFLVFVLTSVACGSAVPALEQNSELAIPIELEDLPQGPENFNCTGKDGYFADAYRNCKVFYRCLTDGTKWAFACPLDMEFSDVEKTCMPASQVECSAVTNPVKSIPKVEQKAKLTKVIESRNCGGPEGFDCIGKDGYYADTYRGCQTFYRCLPDGQQWFFACSGGFLFDEKIGTCLPPDQAECVVHTRNC